MLVDILSISSIQQIFIYLYWSFLRTILGVHAWVMAPPLAVWDLWPSLISMTLSFHTCRMDICTLLNTQYMAIGLELRSGPNHMPWPLCLQPAFPPAEPLLSTSPPKDIICLPLLPSVRTSHLPFHPTSAAREPALPTWLPPLVRILFVFQCSGS